MINYEVVEIDLKVKVVKNIKATFSDSDQILMIPIDEANPDYQRYLAWLENPEPKEYVPPKPNPSEGSG
jgi:hypothetical protein